MLQLTSIPQTRVWFTSSPVLVKHQSLNPSSPIQSICQQGLGSMSATLVGFIPSLRFLGITAEHREPLSSSHSFSSLCATTFKWRPNALQQVACHNILVGYLWIIPFHQLNYILLSGKILRLFFLCVVQGSANSCDLLWRAAAQPGWSADFDVCFELIFSPYLMTFFPFYFCLAEAFIHLT